MTRQFQEKYTQLLRSYFLNPEEVFLEQAYRLGKDLVATRYDIEDIGEMHTLAMKQLAQEFPDSSIGDERGHIPLLEVLVAYGVTLRTQAEWLERQAQALEDEIAERRRAEQALKEYSEQLEEMVEERTQELRDAQEQLVRREKLAVLGKLAGAMAHELRNPLGAISNAAYYLNLVLEEPEPAVKETLEILGKEVRTSEKIISSLLDYARTRPPVRQTVNVNALVEEALARADVPANIQVTTQLDETLPAIQADPDQLAQVFDNLIRNAVQAMPAGGDLVIRSEVSGEQSSVNSKQSSVNSEQLSVNGEQSSVSNLQSPISNL